MRIKTDIDDPLREKVKTYADKNGLKMPRAYRDLIEAGLNSEAE